MGGSSDTRPVQEAASNTAAKLRRHAQTSKNRIGPAQRTRTASNTFSNDSRQVPPKGSLLLQHFDTKGSVAVQTADSVEHEDSLWVCSRPPRRRRLPPRCQPQKRCSSGAPSNIDIGWNSKKLQRRIQRTLDQIRDPSRQLLARTPTAVLKQPGGSNPGHRSRQEHPEQELVRGFEYTQSAPAPTSVPQTQTKRSAPKRCRRPRRDERGDLTSGHAVAQPKKSSIFGGQGEFTEKASAVLQGTPPSSLIHIQTAISHHLHITTLRSHDNSSHRTVHHERTTFHCSVTHSFRLKIDVKHEVGQLSVARGLAEHPGPWEIRWNPCRRSTGIQDLAARRHSQTDQRSWRFSSEQPGLVDEVRSEPAYLVLPCGSSSPARPATANNEECQKTAQAKRNAHGVPPLCAVWPSCRRSPDLL